LNDKVGNLSGGQKQILALLMAVITQPKLLLLDEHTTSLDPKVSKLVLEITRKVVEERKITTLMITHNIHQAIECGGQLFVLENGKVIFKASGKSKKRLSVSQIENLYRNSYT
jgi:putative ABC transport system ATP-binding protein